MIIYDYLNENSRERLMPDANKKHFVDKELSWVEIHNGYVLPWDEDNSVVKGGVITAEKEYLDGTHLHREYGMGYAFEDENVHYYDEQVLYLGCFAAAWGHCITDNIKRMWFLKTRKFKEKFQNCKLVFIAYPNFEFNASFIRFLEILGIDYTRFQLVSNISQYKSIIIPDECFYRENGSNFFTKEYRDIVCKIREYAKEHCSSLTEYEKVYFSYSNYGKNHQIGEEKLESFFEQQGYKIIRPEEHSLEEQLNMLANCKYFASTIGSCSHNTIFLREKASVILIPRANYFTEYQVALNELFDHDIVYIDASMSILVHQDCPWCGPFYYYISKHLLDFFKVQNREEWKETFDDFYEYLKYGQVFFYSARSELWEYYSKPLSEYFRELLNNAFNVTIEDITFWEINNKLLNDGREMLPSQQYEKVCYQLLALSILYLKQTTFKESEKKEYYNNMASYLKSTELDKIDEDAKIKWIVYCFRNFAYEDRWYEIDSFEKQLMVHKAELLRLFNSHRFIVIWGNGKRGQALQSFCFKNGYRNVVVADKKNEEIGKVTKYGYLIIDFKYMEEYEGIVVVSNTKIYKEAILKWQEESRQLLNLEEVCPFG